ncbi:hypothetical protein [Kribbella sp. ALI-6-A]|uniref:hypothetical protein n=1 Tax=Kribbella sp. ALI-6-A TaxID=1933817 RepID=UPI00117A08CA|nr:hypothetical protein [Kribbella sp. ALI-6-A]
MKYCCDYAYLCPARDAVACYAHGGADPCCADESAHACLEDMYGGEDGLMYGDGFVCRRCGNYELTGLEHQPASEPGFPRKYPPGWSAQEVKDGPVVFLVEAVFDLAVRPGVLVSGRLLGGVVKPGATLLTYQERPVRVIAIELVGDHANGRITLLVEREDLRVVPGEYLRT